MDEVGKFAGHDVFDHIHQSGFDSDSGELIPICDFAWHEIDSDGDKDKGLIPLAAASSAIARLLGWICGNGNLLAGGARAASLALLLGHNNDRYRSLAAIARAAGCERATLSRSLLGLRDQFNIKLSMRGSLIRDNCRQAQYESLKAGTHSSLVRKNKTQTSSDDPAMNAQEIRAKFRTLDSARAEIERLQNSGNSSPAKPASPPVKTALTSPPKPIAAHGQHFPPKLEDLSRRELSEALDLANAQGDSEMVRLIYGELTRRRSG